MIGMSGGVDSSVAVYLLQSAGFCCTGATLKLYSRNNPYYQNGLPYPENDDMQQAAQVAEKLNIPFVLLDRIPEFQSAVVDRFVSVYEYGGTPNPCLYCNQSIKFPMLLEEADKRGISYISTGHYARIEQNTKSGRYMLKKAVDTAKDQSYVLYGLSQEILKRLKLPLGIYTKQEIRAIAAEQGFSNSQKNDSQDICFVPDGDYYRFMLGYTGKTYPSGSFVDSKGNVLGTHKGIVAYTIGQRRGLGLSLKQPMYVAEKDTEKNTVILCENAQLFTKTLYADSVNWLSIEKPKKPISVQAKIRYNQKEQPAVVYVQSDDIVKVVFDAPQRAIAKGQAVVFYDGDLVLGGGTIL